MTENKRFKLDSEVGFIDTQKCGGDTMTPFEVVVKLNKLNEENEQLKQNNSDLNDIVLFQKGIVDDWEIEEIEIGMKILCDLYFSVRKEKEQLEQRIKEYEE